jgi:mitotic-spindle organizing protein 1
MSSKQTPTPEEALDIAYEINKILDCGLDKESLSVCIALLETGVTPEALAEVVKKLRAEVARSQDTSQQPSPK